MDRRTLANANPWLNTKPHEGMIQLLQLTGKKITNVTSGAGAIYPLNEDEINIQNPGRIDELIVSIEDYSVVISNRIDFHPKLKSIYV